MNVMQFLRCSAVLFLLTVLTASSQPIYKNTFYGLFTHFSGNFHTGSFHEIPIYPEPPKVQYNGGGGTGFAFGALVDFPLADRFRLNIRIGFANYSGDIATDEPTTFINAGVPTKGVFTHTLTSSLSSVGIEPMGSYTIFGNFRAHAGFRVGTVLSSTIARRVEITQPGQDVFIQGGRVLSNQAAPIPAASSTHQTVLLGASYTITVSPELFFQPEVFYSIPINPVTDNLDWQVSSLRAGVAIMLSPAPTERRMIYDTVILRDTVIRQIASGSQETITLADSKVSSATYGSINRTEINERYVRQVPRPMPKLAFESFGVLPNRDEVPLDSLILEETVSNRLTPLLNYVFFDQNSRILPARYKRLTEEELHKFSVDGLHAIGTLDRYYHLLNIIGKRLTEKQQAKLVITGCISGEPAEKDNPTLSRMRADEVEKYFLDTWHIDRKRITVTSRKLPARPSNEQLPDGSEENRRVEITSNDRDILAPVFTSDTALTSRYTSIILRPKIEDRNLVKEYSTLISQNGNTIAEETTTSKLPKSIEISVEENKINRKDPAPMAVELHIENTNGETADAEQNVPIKVVSIAKSNSERLGTKIIDRYSLILFEFDNADIHAENQKIINFIKARLSGEAKVSITGTTDRMGEESHNQQLSSRRATSAAQALKIQKADVKGAGEDTSTYSNDLPEGRFYSRTVNIVVERNE